MDLSVPASAAELSAAIFQSAVTAALTALCLLLYRRYRKDYFRVWALAWGIYTVRMGAILSFLVTQGPIWLFWHQVTTGWTALALLWAAVVFARQAPWRHGYAIVVAFPPVWSYVAIYRLDSFFLAAWPAVLFLSGATFVTAWTFFAHYRRLGSGAAAFLAGAFFLWGVHHLDYPLLRARGVWNPWGYYVDVFLALLVGAGLLLLVAEDLARGVQTLSTLSSDLQRADDPEHTAQRLVERPMSLGAVTGSALFLADGPAGLRPVARSGVCCEWDPAMEKAATELATRVRRSGRLETDREPGSILSGRGSDHPYLAALPLFRDSDVIGSMLVVGSARDPFAALDDRFLVALGQQVGAALENADLTLKLERRRRELARLAATMVCQHEEERSRLNRELHDETAQVLAALNFQLAALQRDAATPESIEGLGRARELLQDGMRSIRDVTDGLRPPLLDELGLGRALGALVDEFGEQSGLDIRFRRPADSLPVPPEAEVALFRALQEGLSNAARHAGAGLVRVDLEVRDRRAVLRVVDDGRGLENGAEVIEGAGRRGGLGGMRERIRALGGELSLRSGSHGGTTLLVTIPLREGETR